MASRELPGDVTQPSITPKPNSASAFMYLMADVLRLPEETLAMSFMYLYKYQRFSETMEAKLDLDAYVRIHISAFFSGAPAHRIPVHVIQLKPSAASQTISLASLSLASKGTEAPRRLREFLLPAYRILRAGRPSVQPLTFPSTLYDSLRATIVQAELILLRILKFELRIPLPYEFLPRYLERTVGELNLSSNGWGGTEDYDGLGKEFQEEYKAVDLMDTGVSRACRMKILEACANARLSNLFPARAIAAACLYQTLNEGGMQGTMDVRGWLREVTNDRVDLDDFDEILNELKRVNDVERSLRTQAK